MFSSFPSFSSISAFDHSSPSLGKMLQTKSAKGKNRKTANKSEENRFGGTFSALAKKSLSPPKKSRRGSRGSGLKFGGKKPHQVARRNERERKRVQHLNIGYETLATKLSRSCKAFCDKKLTKAETLKEAINYIQHLERLLGAERVEEAEAEANAFHRECLARAAESAECSEDDSTVLTSTRTVSPAAITVSPAAITVPHHQSQSLSSSSLPGTSSSSSSHSSSFSCSSSSSSSPHFHHYPPPPRHSSHQIPFHPSLSSPHFDHSVPPYFVHYLQPNCLHRQQSI